MKRLILIIGVIFIGLLPSFSQIPDSIKTVKKDSFSVTASKDSLKKEVKKEKFVPVPKKALLYSIIPGGGQIYNRKYWYIKVPIVYGALVGGILAVNYNTKYYKYFKNNYYNKVNGLPLDPTLVPNIEKVSQDVLKQQRDNFYKTVQQCYAGIAIGYVLVAAEAFTTAHLMNFDISQDLSLKVKPMFESLPIVNANALGVGVQLRF